MFIKQLHRHRLNCEYPRVKQGAKGKTEPQSRLESTPNGYHSSDSLRRAWRTRGSRRLRCRVFTCRRIFGGTIRIEILPPPHLDSSRKKTRLRCCMSLDYSATRIKNPGERKTRTGWYLVVEPALQDPTPKKVRCESSPILCSYTLSPLCVHD